MSTPEVTVRASKLTDHFQDALQRQELMADLVNRRIAAGIKAKDVARAMGVTPSTVSELENHQDDPRLSTVQRYARAIGIHVEFVALSSAARSWRARTNPVVVPQRRAWRGGATDAVQASQGAKRTDFATAA